MLLATSELQMYIHIYQIQSVRRPLSRHALLTLVRALTVNKVDYCNSVLAGISGQLQDCLQSILNAAARLVFSVRRSERITPLLRELHRSRVPERVAFRLCVLVYRCLSSWNSAVVPCWEPSPDIWRQHTTSSAFCWHSHAGGTVHQTFNTRWPCGFGTCMEHPAVADDVPSRAEDCTFSVVVWQWLGDRDCTALYNLSARDYWLLALLFFLFYFCFILYGALAMYLTL